MNRWHSYIAALLMQVSLVLLLLAAASLATATQVKLKVFIQMDSTATNISVKADRAVLEAFKRKYPDITISSYNGISLDMDTAPLMAVAGGTSPDVIYVNMRKSDSYIRQGIIQPIDEFISTLSPAEINERYIPATRKVAYRRGLDGKQHWYTVPYGTIVRALFYRKDVFRDAGLNPDRPPQNWDELLAYAQRITDPAKGRYGIAVTTGNAVSWEWYSFLASAGGEAMREGKDGNWSLAYNSDAGVRSAYFFSKLVQQRFMKNGKDMKGCVYTDQDVSLKFGRGEIGMMMGYLDDKMIASANPYVTGIAPMPGDGLGHHGSELNSPMMGLFSGVKDPKVKEAAFKLMWFWDGEEARAIRTRVFIENGYGGFVNPMYLRKFGYNEYLKYVPRGWEETLQLALKYGDPEPYGKNCDIVYAIMDRPIQQMLADNVGNMPEAQATRRIKQLLDASILDGREKLLEVVPPEKLRVRRAVALFAALFIVVAFTGVFIYLMRIFTPPSSESRVKWGFRKYWLAYLLLLPATASILIWNYIPLIRGSGIAFYDYRITGGSRFLGLDNFGDILFDPFFWKVLGNTFWYAVLWIGLGFFAPIILALLLSEVPRLKVFFRILFYLPAVISGIVVMFMWKSFYDPSAAGMLNKVISLCGIEPQAWLQNPQWAMMCIIIPIVWASMGPGCLIYLAALKSVPEELYEAADMDGAGTMGKVWHITLPMLKPLIIINLIGAIIGAFNATDNVLVMTGGGPNYVTHVMGLEIFYNAFLYLKFGRAAALGWLMGLILLGFTAYNMKRLSNMTFRAGGQ